MKALSPRAKALLGVMIARPEDWYNVLHAINIRECNLPVLMRALEERGLIHTDRRHSPSGIHTARPAKWLLDAFNLATEYGNLLP